VQLASLMCCKELSSIQRAACLTFVNWCPSPNGLCQLWTAQGWYYLVQAHQWSSGNRVVPSIISLDAYFSTLATSLSSWMPKSYLVMWTCTEVFQGCLLEARLIIQPPACISNGSSRPAKGIHIICRSMPGYARTDPCFPPFRWTRGNWGGRWNRWNWSKSGLRHWSQCRCLLEASSDCFVFKTPVIHISKNAPCLR